MWFEGLDKFSLHACMAAVLDHPQEYCSFEIFQPRCLKNEIIVIKSATYGRMRIGKCITAEEVSGLGEDNKRYFGCSTDVTNILETKCSLRSECDVRVIDPDLLQTNPCFPGLILHLEASFECLNGIDLAGLFNFYDMSLHISLSWGDEQGI